MLDNVPDNPLVRRSHQCPLCLKSKDDGQVTCWPCYAAHGLRRGNPTAEAEIALVEQRLGTADRLTPDLP